MFLATGFGQRGRPAVRGGRVLVGVRRGAASTTMVALVAAGGLVGCDSRTNQPPPRPTAPPASTASTSPEAPRVRAALAVAPDLGPGTSVTAVNEAGTMIISRPEPTGTGFYYLAEGARPVPLLSDGAR